jgi:hypothetical protein
MGVIPEIPQRRYGRGRIRRREELDFRAIFAERLFS